MSELEQRAAERMEQAGRPEDGPACELTDAGNAERFARQHGDDVRYVPEWGWVVWDGRRWARDELQARERMLETARRIYREAEAAAEPKAQDAITKWARQSQQAQRVGAALWCAQPELRASPDEFDRESMLLPVANGTLDLRTGELHAHRREHLATRASDVWFDGAASCPTWHAFLARVFPDDETRAFVKRAAGYSLTGSTAEQSLFFCYGSSGRNGKTVFIETLAALAGEFHLATRIDSLSITRGGGIPSDIARLAGARVVTVSETPEGARLNEPLVKDLTGGDTITACFKYREWFDFRPEFKLWIRGNHKPQIRGTDDGIWRRVLLVPFAVQIPEDEADPALPAKLLDELPGVLAWALQGALEWQRRGLRPPQTVADAVREYRSEMDTLGEFIEDRCIVLPHVQASAKSLYAAYRQWCEDSGHQPVSTTRFGLSLAERGFEKHKPKGVVWHGIGLLSDSSDSCDSTPKNPQSRAHDSLFPGEGSETVGLSDDPDGICPACRGEGDECGWCHGAGRV